MAEAALKETIDQGFETDLESGDMSLEDIEQNAADGLLGLLKIEDDIIVLDSASGLDASILHKIKARLSMETKLLSIRARSTILLDGLLDKVGKFREKLLREKDEEMAKEIDVDVNFPESVIDLEDRYYLGG